MLEALFGRDNRRESRRFSSMVNSPSVIIVYDPPSMSDLDLSSAANVADIISGSTIVFGLIFGWIQIRHYQKQSHDATAHGLMQTFYNKDLAAAIALLATVPDGIRLSELRARGAEFDQAFVTVTSSFETMGLLVFHRIATLELVVDLAGGIISTMNRKLAVCQEEMRVEQSQPSWAEWFTWLGDQVERVKTQRPPAHIAHRGWRG
jgi:hypothetical protein